MLFQKYQIVVFKEKQGCCRKFRLRGWTTIFILLLIIVLVGTNIYLWKNFQKFRSIEKQLTLSKTLVQKQKVQLLTFANKIKRLETDLSRIKEFDTKLRVMMNLEPEQVSLNSLGGAPDKGFPNTYFPLYRQELLTRKMHNFLDQLSTEARLEEIRQQELLETIRSQKNILAATPSIWPTQGWISSEFGYRISPFTGRREFHKGLDISGPVGTPIYAPADGKVVFTGKDGSYGISLVIDHGLGITTRYAHLSRYVVKKKQKVTRGEIIAYMGNSGRSTGPHLHYEVRLNGMPVNPLRYILN
ncbi:M23 family metallopeptidase [Desulfohalobiaceae bacterium Ax17]|uniref:M23 family metallopeptidase n=1 Tax=Desulfovulcanus ferrireducens TaxID=2831190 RepID=UPI00207BB762|nr:M23 family metallopeptidase [Desulfovulcanus ferrireducens]MBT8763823.1 M23 family metallopeptidase [Desulfovulcanus ferrireducens]